MIEELEKLIDNIIKEYQIANTHWEQNQLYQRINLKKKLVKDLKESNDLLQNIINYRSFIREEVLFFIIELQSKYNINGFSSIEARIKAQNSIEYKIDNYIKNHENGEEPIIKCFNDLFGVRIIYDKDIQYEEIHTFIVEKYPKLRCIESIRGDYVATHIYLKENNFSFPWELQIWNRKNEKNNKESHKRYKQAYAEWELENKGGVV